MEYGRKMDVEGQVAVQSTPKSEPRSKPADLFSQRVPWGPIGEQVYRRTYSQKKPDGRKENWAETVRRVVDGNLALVGEQYIEKDEREKLYQLLYTFDGLPAGRHLSASGMKGRQFLFNCFQGDTLVLTKEGFQPIKSLQGKKVVLSQGEKEQTGPGTWKYGTGAWRTADFKSYGVQRLYKVRFSDGTEVEATADHKWYVTKRSGPVETKDLQGHTVPLVTAPKPERNQEWQRGILHGFVYGDGTVSRWGGKTFSAHVQLFGEKDKALIPLFEKAGYKVSYPDYCSAYVGQLPAEWKELPLQGASRSYWRGFLSGLLAADGTVDKQGCIYLFQADKQALETVRLKAIECGFSCTNILLHREKSPFTGEDAHLYRFAIRRFSVEPVDLVIAHHRENFELAGESCSGRSLQVVSVEDTGRDEEVYCCVEPETHTIVIDNSILSGQCHASGWDVAEPAAHFTFLFDALMQGGGVGANYSNRYLQKMPAVRRRVDLRMACRADHPNVGEFSNLLWDGNPTGRDYVEQPRWSKLFVEDSREGWVDAVELVLETAFAPGQDELAVVVLDVGGIRERGAPLKTSGGIACGPGPLVKMLVEFVSVLNGCAGQRLTSLQAMALDHALAGCVVAGGKRRSSRMSVKNWLDYDIFDFLGCKKEDGKHWSTNISVEVDEDFYRAYHDGGDPMHKWARDVMRSVVVGKQLNGEPGLWNRTLSMKDERDPEAMYCPNPCGEIALQMWENCNLGHINLAAFVRRPVGEMREAFRLMARWLMRATFGDVPNPRQREVLDRNRRIGVGFFGFHEWLALNGIRYSDCHNNDWVISRLKAMRDVVDQEAVRYARILSIPVPVKTTTLAPTGTTVCLPGTTSSAQALMAPWYKRLVRYSDMDEELAIKRLEGYEVFRDDDAPDTSIVVFWCEDPLVAKVRAAGFEPAELLEGQYDVAFETSLKVQSMLQEVWANNAISFTINLKHPLPSPGEMEACLVAYLPRLKGTTVFAPTSRKNVPIQPVSKAEFDAHPGHKEVTQVEDECKTGCPVK